MRRQRQRVPHQHAADDLINRIMTPDILRHIGQLTVHREQSGRMQTSGFVEDSLSLAEAGRHLRDRGSGDTPGCLDGRHVGRQRLDRSTATQTTRCVRRHLSAPVQKARQPLLQSRRQGHVDDVLMVAGLIATLKGSRYTGFILPASRAPRNTCLTGA